ncbi:MAG TPA: hypothetical protein ENJ30_10525 [Desulfobulbaceae bacterium]|nr:hypothetical protein [Desulfobulbaceae bacterium]
MGKKGRSAINYNYRLLCCGMCLSFDKICLSGQTAQLMAASAAGLEFTPDIVAVQDGYFFAGSQAVGCSGEDDKENAKKKKEECTEFVMLILHWFVLALLIFFAT